MLASRATATPAPPPPAEADVVVAGGGPAGATIAGLLAHLGHCVAVLEASRFPRDHVGESLTPSIHRLFELLGIRRTIDAAGFVRMPGHTFRWSDGQRTLDFRDAYGAPVLGYQVWRRQFDTLLRDRAEQLGAMIHHGYRVRETIDEGGRAVGVRYTAPGGAGGRLRARLVIDATGAVGTLARSRGLRRTDAPVRNMALWAYWEDSAPPPACDPRNTYVESFPDGWIWTVLVRAKLRNVTVMVDLDAERENLRAAGPEAFYRKRIAGTVATRAMLEPARRVTRVRGCNATWFRSPTPGGDGLLLIGDAASLVDPLTSQGVRKALGSAIAGSVAANTLLVDRSMAGAALDYLAGQEARLYDHLRRVAVASLLEERTHRDRPFWSRRTRATLGDPGPEPPPPRRGVLRDLVRETPLQRVVPRWTAGTRVARRVVAEGARLVRRPAMIGAQQPDGRTYPDLDPEALFPIIDGVTTLPEVVDRYLAATGREHGARAAVLRAIERLVDDRFCDVVVRA